MRTHPTHHNAQTGDIAIPSHLARYAAEVDAWRTEALAHRAAQAHKTGSDR